MAASGWWQVPQAGGGRFGAWTASVWQLAHDEWPVATVAMIGPWQVAQVGRGAVGVCAALVWQVVHAAWPEPAVLWTLPWWQVEQNAVLSTGLPSCGWWQSRQLAVPCSPLVWHVVHATASPTRARPCG